jgi:16S rRNA pseudouridine516 synthase
LNLNNFFVVGRLDKDTTGLVVITNDGKWAHKIKGPKSNTEKEYKITAINPIDKSKFDIFDNFKLDGKLIKKPHFTKVKGNSCILIITEGKYHQVKRMFKAMGNEVKYLKRIRIGTIKLNNLRFGEYCELIFPNTIS